MRSVGSTRVSWPVRGFHSSRCPHLWTDTRSIDGQTGSGKSYSMMGCKFFYPPVYSQLFFRHLGETQINADPFTDGADKGIIPLTCEELFRRLDEKRLQDTNIDFRVEVSYIEVSPFTTKRVLRFEIPHLLITRASISCFIDL
jgi:Kinesin motor domain